MEILSSDIFIPMSVGLVVWLFTYGLNRIYLFVKNMLS